MSEFNKSQYCIILLKKPFKKKTKISDRNKTYVLALCIKSNHNKYFVLHKLGILDFINKKFYINFFRFIFWMQYRPSFSSKTWEILYKNIFSKNWNK